MHARAVIVAPAILTRAPSSSSSSSSFLVIVLTERDERGVRLEPLALCRRGTGAAAVPVVCRGQHRRGRGFPALVLLIFTLMVHDEAAVARRRLGRSFGSFGVERCRYGQRLAQLVHHLESFPRPVLAENSIPLLRWGIK